MKKFSLIIGCSVAFLFGVGVGLAWPRKHTVPEEATDVRTTPKTSVVAPASVWSLRGVEAAPFPDEAVASTSVPVATVTNRLTAAEARQIERIRRRQERERREAERKEPESPELQAARRTYYAVRDRLEQPELRSAREAFEHRISFEKTIQEFQTRKRGRTKDERIRK